MEIIHYIISVFIFLSIIAAIIYNRVEIQKLNKNIKNLLTLIERQKDRISKLENKEKNNPE